MSNRLPLAYVILSSLVVCSLLGVALATVDFGEIFGADDDAANWEDPNADLIAEQQTVVAQNPDDVEELLFLANLLGNTDRINEAVPLYEQAIAMRPDDLSIRVDFARTLSAAGLREDAETQFLVVLETEPDNQVAHYYLAELYRLWDPPRADEAVQHYRRVVEIDTETFLADQAEAQLMTLAAATPGAPAASPEGTP